MTDKIVIEESRPSRFGWSRSRVIFLAISAGFLGLALWWTSEVILPFVMALIIAYVLTPAVALCERIKIPRSLSIILVYIVTLGTLYLSIAAVAPRLYEETMSLARDVPQITEKLTTRWAPRLEGFAQGILDRVAPREEATPETEQEPKPALEIKKRADGSFTVELRSGVEIVQEDQKHWRVQPASTETPDRFSASRLAREAAGQAVDYVKRNAVDLLKVGQAIFGKVARSIFLFFLTLMVAAYLMHTREAIVAFFRTLPPQQSRASFDRLLHRIDRGLAGVVRGQLLICLVNGLLSAVGFWMFGLKYWPILAIVAAVMSIIPIFGSILSTVPAVLIGLTQDFFMALWVLLWIIGIHQVEANLLNPKIIGTAAKIHPVLVVFSLIVGEHFFGLWGALLAVPALSLSQSLFLHFRYELMPDSGPDSLLPPPLA
ncbi:MAG: AI-2E family transporter [Myxococcales bacterium]|nr:AI-2E family transporter [Myxococcales bacterium]